MLMISSLDIINNVECSDTAEYIGVALMLSD